MDSPIVFAPLEEHDMYTVWLWRQTMRSSLRTSGTPAYSEQQRWFKEVICNPQGPHKYWGIRDNKHELLGVGGLTNWEPINRNAEISLLIDPAMQGKRIGVQAVVLLLHEGFMHMGLNAIYGECYFCNPSALRFWENQIEKHRGTSAILSARKWWNGQFWDSFYFTFTAYEYAQRLIRLQGTLTIQTSIDQPIAALGGIIHE